MSILSTLEWVSSVDRKTSSVAVLRRGKPCHSRDPRQEMRTFEIFFLKAPFWGQKVGFKFTP
jgi:hypothetical protein